LASVGLLKPIRSWRRMSSVIPSYTKRNLSVK
jgi:hypothetical protein